jgi:hypothetical protein
MTKGKARMVAFIVEFEDGSTGRITIDEFTLRSGEHVARIVAAERNPGRKVKHVRRAPPNEQPT